jgi:hypothetical protein
MTTPSLSPWPLASGNSLVSTHHGQIKLLNHFGEMVTFARVLLIEDRTFNLISVTQLTERGLSVNFTKELCTLNRLSTPILTAQLVSCSWMVNCKAIISMVQGLFVRHSPPVKSRAKPTLDLIHTDLCGPMEVDGQKKYMMVIVDDRTRYIWVYFLERKSDAFECFKQWLVRV